METAAPKSSDKTDNQPKPCPTCGGRPRTYGGFDQGYRVICCGKEGVGNELKDALWQWNNLICSQSET